MTLKTLRSLESFLPLRLFLRFPVAAVEGIDGEVSICTRTNAVTTACRTYPLARPLDIHLKINVVTTLPKVWRLSGLLDIHLKTNAVTTPSGDPMHYM